jgi:hypothetical protein
MITTSLLMFARSHGYQLAFRHFVHATNSQVTYTISEMMSYMVTGKNKYNVDNTCAIPVQNISIVN